jgi:hypothetical protein
MTKSAKQDTTKAPADPAETEAVETESAATEPVGEDPQADAAQAAPAAADDDAGPDLDETKRKFREALERKHQAHNDGTGGNGRDGSKINGAHGPAASRRSFRRKSG